MNLTNATLSSVQLPQAADKAGGRTWAANSLTSPVRCIVAAPTRAQVMANPAVASESDAVLYVQLADLDAAARPVIGALVSAAADGAASVTYQVLRVVHHAKVGIEPLIEVFCKAR